MKDYIVRGVAANASIRAFAATTKNLVEDARKIHSLSPAATVALGRTLTANGIMSCFSKGENDTLTIQIRGNGPIGGIVTVGRAGFVRGYVQNPLAPSLYYSNNKLNIGEVVGKEGYLNIIRDIGLKEPYIGYIKLVSGEIAEDLSHYFAYSEQIPTIVSLGVLLDKDRTCVANSGGFFIQLMPESEPDIINFVEDSLKNLPSVTIMQREGMKPEEILEKILGKLCLTIYETIETGFKCNCSRERMSQNLITLGKKEIGDMIEETGEAELQCHFCNSYYKFDKFQLQEIYNIV